MYEWAGIREAVPATADGGNRYRDAFVIAHRFDTEPISEQAYERNHNTYQYSMAAEVQPKDGDDLHNEYNFKYYMTECRVYDNSRGKATIHTFDDAHKHLTENCQVDSANIYNKSFLYNSDRLLIKETNTIQGNSASRTEIREWSYDGYGNLLTKTDPLGNRVEYAYHTGNYCLPRSKNYFRDPANTLQIVEAFDLAASGKQIGTHKLSENGTLKRHTEFTYNANGTLQGGGIWRRKRAACKRSWTNSRPKA